MTTAPHIVLAEDNPTLAQSLRLSLEGYGYRVTVAPDGWAAADCASGEDVDALITDHDLPGLTGSQLCFILRERPQKSRLPIIMITGNGRRLDLPWLHAEHHLTAVFEKPVGGRQLVEVLRSSRPQAE